MVRKIKNILYFFVASYFAFFARLKLKRWKPRVVAVTGSNGKTTTLHLIEAALGDLARYSHGANSSFGIPFDILGLKRRTFSPVEWFWLVLAAPFCVLKRPYRERIYVAEADCDRPGEGGFLSALLRPEIVLWLSSARTHSMNFDKSVRAGAFPNVEEAIAHEFGYFPEYAARLVIVNGDIPLIEAQLPRTKTVVHRIRESALGQYEIAASGTSFTIHGRSYRFPYLLPRETFYSIAAVLELAAYLDVSRHVDFSTYAMPPGRSSIFKGTQGTTIIDSTYNANASSTTALLGMVERLPGEQWLVFGDMIEQGEEEKEEHEKVALRIASGNFAKVLLVGPRTRRFAQPHIPNAIAYDAPRDALAYLLRTIKGGETLIFKGARFLEGIVEHLLADKKDVEKLCRREAIWRKRRAQWGL
ncbi:MAG: hypothetical protein RLZZ416_218 [Candidatus Parcubacteria bacterium]|jgi:UDP-N-acetylmuramoyl-tripeptide--D-alanyl-D-alanine ligase